MEGIPRQIVGGLIGTVVGVGVTTVMILTLPPWFVNTVSGGVGVIFGGAGVLVAMATEPIGGES